jgi:hypothetical protein
MNIKYMMFKDRYIFSYDAKLVPLSSEDENARSNEVSLYLKELTLYSVSINLLTRQAPKYSVKNQLLNIAYFCTEEKFLYDSIKANRKLPFKKLSDLTFTSKSFIEKWQHYIIAYFLLLSNKNYYRLKNYLNIKNTRINEENNDATAVVPLNQSKNTLTGIVLQTSTKSTSILNPQGDFHKIQPDNTSEISIGAICAGEIKRDLYYYKYPIAFISICFFISILIFAYIYTKPNRTILIDANSKIKIKTNAWDKTVQVKPLTMNGTTIIKALNLFNKPLDDSIYLILKEAHEKGEAYEKNVVTEKTEITIFITGSKKESPNLIKTSAYISEHNLQVSVNNNGVEHKIKRIQK